jgi:hypothetical protein
MQLDIVSVAAESPPKVAWGFLDLTRQLSPPLRCHTNVHWQVEVWECGTVAIAQVCVGRADLGRSSAGHSSQWTGPPARLDDGGCGRRSQSRRSGCTMLAAIYELRVEFERGRRGGLNLCYDGRALCWTRAEGRLGWQRVQAPGQSRNLKVDWGAVRWA